MKQIKNFDVHSLRNDEDFGYQSRVMNLATTLLVQEADKSLLSAYKPALDAFDVALKQSQKNSQTDAVETADKAVDRLYVGLSLYLRSLEYHPVDTVCTEAAKVLAIIDKYGSLTNLPYNQQYGALHNSLQELNALSADVRQQLQLDAWLDALAEAVIRFDAARAAQTEEQSLYQVGAVKDTRTAADVAYKQFVVSVNAFAIAFGETNYAAFIDQINVMIADIQAELKARKTRAEKADAKEPLPEEQTGSGM